MKQMANRFLILKWLIALLRNEINERCNVSLFERTCFRNAPQLAGVEVVCELGVQFESAVTIATIAKANYNAVHRLLNRIG